MGQLKGSKQTSGIKTIRIKVHISYCYFQVGGIQKKALWTILQIIDY